MEKFDKKAIDAKVAAGFPLTDRWHNRFHLEMPFGLINDPNGMTFANGEYHIFYQWNPLGCEHKNKCWAHVKTRDFVHYSLPELSLWPSDEHDKDGCYSGCGFTEKGEVRVFYTCNAKNDGVRTPAQRLGTLQADGHVEKDEIVVPDSPEGITGHFRDPYLFHRHGKRYFVIGAQADEEKPRGTVLIYKETKDGWQNLGELKTRLQDFGYMWECPNMLHFGSYDALIFCPQGLEAREFDRQNIYQAGYIAGHLSLDSMDMMQHTKFQELDHGFDFYAPQVTQTPDGRCVMIGWLAMWESAMPEQADGWSCQMTVPRELHYRKDKLVTPPARELTALRKAAHMMPECVLSEETSLGDWSYETGELCADLDLTEAKGVAIHFTAGFEDTVSLMVEKESGLVTLSRKSAATGRREERYAQLPAGEEHLSLHVYEDRSSLEFFLNDGDIVMSTRFYPKTEERVVVLEPQEGTVRMTDGVFYELDDIFA